MNRWLTRLQVRVLLDTGPTAEEVQAIHDLFDELDMDAVAEGHSYGGPPPTSAFLIVLNSPLAPFLDRFAAPGGIGSEAFERMVRQLQAMRAEPSRWGRAHGIKLEDSHSGHGVLLPGGLPAPAYPALMEIDLSGLDQAGAPVQVEWCESLRRWQARLTTAPHRFARRVPTRQPAADMPRAREMNDAEVSQLWRLAGNASPSVVTWHRAQIVLSSAFGRNVPTIARQMVTTPERVRAVIRNFNRDGFDSLDFGYRGGEPVIPTPEEERDARAIAGRSPADYGLPALRWDARSLGEFLVTEGLVEEVDPSWLDLLLDGAADRPVPVAAGPGLPTGSRGDSVSKRLGE